MTAEEHGVSSWGDTDVPRWAVGTVARIREYTKTIDSYTGSG